MPFFDDDDFPEGVLVPLFELLLLIFAPEAGASVDDADAVDSLDEADAAASEPNEERLKSPGSVLEELCRPSGCS